MKKSKKTLLTPRQQVIQVLLFCAVLIIGMIIGFCIFFRPSFSDREKRELTKFPSFSLEGMMNGDYWSQITTWYADTYPMRDVWLDMNNTVQSAYGIQNMKVQNLSNQVADDIPDIDESRTESSIPQNSSAAESSIEESSKSENPETSKEESSHTSKIEFSGIPVIPDDAGGTADELEDQIMAGIFVNGDAAYSRYYFVLDNANAYIDNMNNLAEVLKGKTNVYSILVPESTQIVLDDGLIAQLGGSNEEQAIRYYYTKMSNQIHKIDTFGTLKEHRDEYIYFRTDHHWTARGAYYVYRNLAAEKGITPLELEDFTYASYGDFLGSYYEVTSSSAMSGNPDTLEAWIPNGTNEEIFWDDEGEKFEWKVVFDVSDWDIGSKYNAFIGGDNPFTQIVNPEITDGSSVVLVKESFGNALAPFLVDMYEYVYVIDYRYYSGSILDFVTEYRIDDLIICNDLMLAATDYVVERLDKKFS